jgi:hypothetical protein
MRKARRMNLLATSRIQLATGLAARPCRRPEWLVAAAIPAENEDAPGDSAMWSSRLEGEFVDGV